MLAGVGSMMPPAVIMGLLTGRQQDREEVLIGQYNTWATKKLTPLEERAVCTEDGRKIRNKL